MNLMVNVLFDSGVEKEYVFVEGDKSELEERKTQAEQTIHQYFKGRNTFDGMSLIADDGRVVDISKVSAISFTLVD